MIENNVIRNLTRRELFRSQSELARAAGIRPHTISGKKHGENVLTMAQMKRVLAYGLENGIPVTPADFFPDIEWADKATRGAAA